MENEYILFSAGMFGLIFGGVSALLSGLLLIIAISGIIQLSVVSMLALTAVVLISLIGSTTSYFWFIEAA